jgi:6-phosphofructokinase 1
MDVRAIGVLTSGGDSQGMNATLRAVARTALAHGVAVYAVHEGYEGLVRGGDLIRRLRWADLGGILHRGGTVIGTARSAAFRTREGQLRAAANLLRREISGLVVIGGDGSLTGASAFRTGWPAYVAELVAGGAVSPEQGARCPHLRLVGLVGSIDNDFCGTDMTIGADSALRRITEAIDALTSTAASHQRTFVVEVMGRSCGYLALTSAVACGAHWLFIPERPPQPGWEGVMCARLRAGREAGRRDTIVVVAEGARDADGRPIGAEYVRGVLEARLGWEARVTTLGHVQRGGAPSAFDRWMGALVGHEAVEALLRAAPEEPSVVIGVRADRPSPIPLLGAVEETRAVATAIAGHDYERAMALRGGSFAELYRTYRTLAAAAPGRQVERADRRRIAVLHAGDPAPGMNAAVRVAVRTALEAGLDVLGVRNGLAGLAADDVAPLSWLSVDGWEALGGAELGTSPTVPAGTQLEAIARTLTRHRVGGLLLVGGWPAYHAALALERARGAHPAFDLPVVCLPATINGDLPGTELCVGADSALNTIVEALDKIKQSAVATKRCFIVEVLGGECGYLALMSALASGAEQAYLPEEGLTARRLLADLDALAEDFRRGKRLGLVIRSEAVNPLYTTGFIRALFEEEGGDAFGTDEVILGHLQQGGSPSPFDRILATRLAVRAVEVLRAELPGGGALCASVGMVEGQVQVLPVEHVMGLADTVHRRPRDQWWLGLRPLAARLARPPSTLADEMA